MFIVSLATFSRSIPVSSFGNIKGMSALFVRLCPHNTAIAKVCHSHGLGKGTNNENLAKDVHQSGIIFGFFRHKRSHRYLSHWLPWSGSGCRFFPVFFTVERLVKSGYFAWAFSFSQRLSDLFCFLLIGWNNLNLLYTRNCLEII